MLEKTKAKNQQIDWRSMIFTSIPKQMEGYWLHHYFQKMLKVSMDRMQSDEEAFWCVLTSVIFYYFP